MSSLQTILITGAGSGIGYKTAELFAERGWQVIACTKDGTGFPIHPHIRGMMMNVNNVESIETCFHVLDTENRMPTVLVNNAAWGVVLPFEALTEEDMTDMLNINVLGAMRTTKVWLRYKKTGQKMVMITVGSLAGHIGLLYHTLYCATKSALRGWTESLSYELEPLGVHVKIVEPFDRVDTAFFAKAQAREEQRIIPKPYAERYALYKKKMSTGFSLAPSSVAETIFKAATDGKRSVQYVVSHSLSTRLFVMLHTLFPSIAIRLLQRRYNRMVG